MSEIYPQSVFENQTNGTVFYKEGKLNDPMMPAKTAGIFESWRYSFDDGRQVFKATDGSDKVYEKRIIKDRFGNPHWSEWFEISEAENKGVKAIAINGQPLLLPNADGAIKLHITPQMIDTYTKAEISRLIERGVASTSAQSYTYVKWDDTCSTAYEVLRKAYPEEPDGDIISNYFIVEPKPIKGDIGQESNKATYFMYDTAKADFVEIDNSVDMRAYVSYTAFNEHANDDVAHITADERTLWNKAADDADASVANIEDIYAKLAEYNKTIEDHMADIGEATSPHITIDERARLNSVFENTKEMPQDESRYVVNNGDYVLAYEQPQTSSDVESNVVKTLDSLTARKDGDVLLAESDNLAQVLADIRASNNVVTRVAVRLSNINISKKDAKLNLVGDNGYISDDVTSQTLRTFDLPLNTLPSSLSLKLSDSTATAVFAFTVTVEYKKMLAVDIGDPERKLAVNLVGPEDALPSYNGTPLTDIVKDSAESAKWGNITGDISAQTDLDLKIANAISGKLNVGDMTSHLRFDVYRDGLIKSICQQLDNAEEKTVEVKGKDGAYNKDTAIITGVKAAIADLKSAGYVVYYTRLVIDNISVYNDENGNPLPVSFATDNSGIAQSGNVSGAFNWDWPSNSFESFDSVYLKGNNAQYITNAKIVIKAVKYGDITIGMDNETTGKKYSVTIEAETLNETATSIVLSSTANVSIKAGTSAQISANEVLSLGSTAYSYDDEKENDKVSIYGQEADKRYASREKYEKTAETLETEISDREAADTAEKEAREAADTAIESSLNDRIGTLEGTVTAKLEEADKKANETLDKATELANEVKDEAAKVQTNLDTEINDRKNADSEIIAKADEDRASFEALKASYDETIPTLATKAELEYASEGNTEAYDLVINDSDELTKTVSDGTFEAAKRILFKTGDYILTGEFDSAKVLNLSSVRYIKGETPVSVTLDLAGVTSYEKTVFDNIDFTVGKTEIAYSGERTLEVTASGSTAIELLPEYSVYKIDIEDDASLTFTNAADGKEYVFYIDQKDEPKTVKITNFTYNSNAEFGKGLDNQNAKERTVIRAIARNTPTKDAFIISEVIYGVLYQSDSSQLIKVLAKNTTVSVYKSTVKEQAVSFAEDEEIAVTYPGKSFSLEPKILDGYAHAEDGEDYTVELNDGTVIGTGKCNELTSFTVPETVSENETIYVRFHLKPQLVTLAVDDIYSKYLSKKDGLVKVQAGRPAEITLEAADGFVLYGVTHDQISSIYEGEMPYQFTPAVKTDRLDYTLQIVPKLYADFDDFTLTTVSEYPFNKESVALIGANSFLIEPEFKYDVKNDANFGTAYTAAPITLIASSYYEGSVSFADAGKTQTAAITFNDTALDQSVSIEFAIAHHGDTVTKTFYIGNIDSAYIVSDELELTNGKYILRTYANESKKFTFTADLKNVNDLSGTWAISGNGRSIAAIDSFEDNKVVIAAAKNGTATLQFTSAFTGITYSVAIETRVYAKSAVCSDIQAYTDSTVTPAVTFYDYNGDAVTATKLYDSSFAYKSSSDYLNVDSETSIYVNNVQLPDGVTLVEETYTAEMNDTGLPTEVTEGKITVLPKKFKISFTIAKDTAITLVTVQASTSVVNNSCYAATGSTVSVTIKLANGSKATANAAALEAAFGNITQLYDGDGLYIATFKMPTHDVAFELA